MAHSDAEPQAPNGGHVSDRARFVEARRAGQEALAWQTLSFFFIVQGILVAGALNRSGGHTGQWVLALAGIVTSLIFFLTYLQARSVEWVCSRWLRTHASLDHHTIRDEIRSELRRDPPDDLEWWQGTRVQRALTSKVLKASTVWPILFAVSAASWFCCLGHVEGWWR